jgi:5-methylcytosine-specific restriction endonuclease McrA
LSGGDVVRIRGSIRDYLLDRADHRCEMCGQGEVWNGKSLTLQIDHIDGHWENNRPENLRVLCPHCHTQTDTYGSKNNGHGRDYRYK